MYYSVKSFVGSYAKHEVVEGNDVQNRDGYGGTSSDEHRYVLSCV